MTGKLPWTFKGHIYVPHIMMFIMKKTQILVHFADVLTIYIWNILICSANFGQMVIISSKLRMAVC